MGRGVRVVTVARLGGGLARLGRFRHVFGLDQTCDHLERAVIADGDDAPGHREVLALEDRARLDGALDFVEAGLDAFGFLDHSVCQLGLVEAADLVVAGLQLLDLGLLLVGRRAGLGLDAAVTGGVVPGDLDHGGGPLPAGRQLVGSGLELLGRQLLQQHRVLEPDAVLVFLGEQVAHDLTAGGLVGVHADEAGDRGAAGDPLLGEQALHLSGRRAVALAGDLFPDRHLALAVGGDGEGLQHFEVDLVRPVGVQQLGRGVAEAQALLDDALGCAEACRDGGYRLAGVGELGERDHLVGGVHGDADDVLGERELGGIGVAGPDLAGHRMVGIEHLVLDQRLHGLQAAPAGDHGEALRVILTRVIGADHEVLQQPEGGDGGLERSVGLRIGRRLADVLGGEREPAQRDLPDERFGPGGDVVHANLHGRLRTCGVGGPLRPPLRPPERRPRSGSRRRNPRVGGAGNRRTPQNGGMGNGGRRRAGGSEPAGGAAGGQHRPAPYHEVSIRR